MSSPLEQAAAIERLIQSSTISDLGIPSAEALLTCCNALIEHGSSERALGLVGHSVDLFAALPAAYRLRHDLLAARALHNLSRDQECLAHCRSHLANPETAALGAEEAAIQLRIYEGASLWRLNRADESVSVLDAVRANLLGRPDGVTMAMCAIQLSNAHMRRGDWAQMKLYSIEAAVSARRSGSLYWESIAKLNCCIADRAACRWASSVDYGQEALSGFERLGNPLQVSHVRRSLAIAEWKRGRLAEAERLATKCIEDADSRSAEVHRRYGQLFRAAVLIHQGSLDEALAVLRSLVELEPLSPQSRQSLLAVEFIGDVFLEQGNLDGAMTQYELAWTQASALIPRGDIVLELRRRRAECLLREKPSEAHAEAGRALLHAREISDRYEEAAVFRILALSCAAMGKPADARAAFEQGFAMFDDIETPYEWGKLWMSYGDWLCGEHAAEFHSLAGANEAYRAALGHFEHIGAELRLKQVRERLSRLEASTTSEADLGGGKVRPLRRPRISADLQRRSQWALDTFGIVTRNRQILDMLDDVAKIAKSDMAVLILGQSGTGKELVANGTHRLSGRTGRCVPINCGAIPATMIEDELFGHVDGAFTNAIKEKAGLFEVAHEGTAFLDEIGEMSVELQSKLLRFLESGEFRRIGGTTSVRVNTRIVAATNRDRARLESGESFRTDLYYRLAHAVYTLPPLSQRGDDVELLIEHFLDQFCEEQRRRVSFSAAAMDRLRTHGWPGNVRQLRSVVQRLVVQSKPDHIVTPIELSLSDDTAVRAGLEAEMEREERSRIMDALEKTDYVKAEAARLMRMSRTTLIAKMKRLGIND